MRIRRRQPKSLISWLAIACFLSGLPRALAQEPAPCDAPVGYENHNQIDPKPLKVRSVAGQAKVEGGLAVFRLCLALFTEKEHRLVATTRGDENGRFAFSAVRPGRYRLLAESPGFCTANVPLWVGGGSLAGVSCHLR